MKSFKFFDDNIKVEPPVDDGWFGIFYRDSNNNLFVNDVIIIANEHYEPGWFDYDTGFITMDYFFTLYPPGNITKVVESIVHDGTRYWLNSSNDRQHISNFIFNSNDRVRIIGKQMLR